jgi:hypothetical protein
MDCRGWSAVKFMCKHMVDCEFFKKLYYIVLFKHYLIILHLKIEPNHYCKKH